MFEFYYSWSSMKNNFDDKNGAQLKFIPFQKVAICGNIDEGALYLQLNGKTRNFAKFQLRTIFVLKIIFY